MTEEVKKRDTDYPPFIQYLLAFAVYTPAFALFNAIGLAIIFLLGYFGFIDSAPVQLLGVAGCSFLLALSLLPSQRLIRSGRLSIGQGLLAGGAGVFIALSNLFWSGLTYFLHAVVWLPALLQVFRAENNKQRIPPAIAGIISTAIVIVTELWLPFERVPFNSGSTLLGFWFFIFSLTVLIVLVLTIQIIPFRQLSGRLLVSFLVIVTLPILIISLVSGFQTYQQDQRRIVDQLDTVGKLKENQIRQIIEPIPEDLSRTLQNAQARQRLQYILTERATTTLYQTNYDLLLAYFNDNLRETGRYEEIFIVKPDGRIFISSENDAIGTNISEQPYFQAGLEGSYLSVTENRFSDVGKFGTTSIIATEPVYGTDGSVIGVAGLRSSFDSIAQVMSIDPGVGDTDASYLVDQNYRQLTPILSTQGDLRTQATQNAIENKRSGFGSYENKDGIEVIGTFRWIAPLNVALITELTVEEAVAGTIGIIVSNIVLGLFTISIATMAVFLTARSISLPIVDLSEAVSKVAGGNLQVRSNIERQDEIGQLSNSFNAMAEELQSMVTGLEERVAGRTLDLEQQAVRLRVASEVARDAASARDLDDLLNRSATLIMERFKFYHTGIFLLDEKREYAVLRASPTEAGKTMLENKHKLRIGETGIVGYVAALGDARIALDTGEDAVHFRNPLLPNTRSEIGLPLKANNQVIGVLDVQSELPEAFTQDDVAILQIMADQLATAIERTRLLQEVEQNLIRMEQTYQQYTESSWRKFTTQRVDIPGYNFQGTVLKPISECPPEARDALIQGSVVVLEHHDTLGSTPYSLLAVPVKLRGQTIGVFNIKLEGETVSEEIVSTIEEAAARFAIALENSRLVSETQLRADRERMVAEVTTRIGATVETDDILRVTVEELGKVLGNTQVAFRLKTPTNGKNN